MYNIKNQKIQSKMIRQNIDGRSIYSYQVWCEILKSGEKLKQLGYKESYNKPNLFYKPIGENGVIYADLRGNDWIPLWEDSGLNVYYYGDLPYHIFLNELILIQRAGCHISSFNDDFERFSFRTLPNGYCKTCQKDILPSIKWDVLSEEKGISTNIELLYCDECKLVQYEQKKIREELKQFQNDKRHTCRLCGTIKVELLTHHITYEPEEIMKVCRSCHGIIHACSFPNYLWKQKKPKPEKKEKISCKFCGKNHWKTSPVGINHLSCAKYIRMQERENALRADIFINPEITKENLKKANNLKRKMNHLLTEISYKHHEKLLRKARALPKHQ